MNTVMAYYYTFSTQFNTQCAVIKGFVQSVVKLNLCS